MELRIAKSYLSQGIQIVSKAVPSKTTMSILECILIDASGNEIRLIANDMELGRSSRFSARTERTSRIFPRSRRRAKLRSPSIC